MPLEFRRDISPNQSLEMDPNEIRTYSTEGTSPTNDVSFVDIEGPYSRVYALSSTYIPGPTVYIKDLAKTMQTVGIVQTYVLQ